MLQILLWDITKNKIDFVTKWSRISVLGEYKKKIDFFKKLARVSVLGEHKRF